jgi:3-oxoacyl-[acyl-carrier protein] reductase
MNNKPVALITGGSRGIGKELVYKFSKAGYFVIINCIKSSDKAMLLAEEICDARAITADISNHEEVKKMVVDITAKEGKIDVLVNNAGIAKNNLIINMPENDWDNIVRTNLTGPFYLIRECSKIMIKQKSGSIINIASIIAKRGQEGCSNYGASKAGLVSLTKTAAKELGRFGICVNAVFPGFHSTDMGKTAKGCYVEKTINESVLKRTTDINELADFLVLLAGMKSVSGQVFNIDSRII